MKVLLGTTNPSKVEWIRQMLAGCDIDFVTPTDLGIVQQPVENGATPQDNARIKAEFYSKYCDKVICEDSGLYFDGLPLDDSRQPAQKVRTPNGIRLNDRQMITYYSNLVKSLGGKVVAYYLNAISVYNHGKISTLSDTNARLNAFYMVDTPSPKLREGWPLDSLSININNNTYFVDNDEMCQCAEQQAQRYEYNKRLAKFIQQALRE